jgi:asparagine synthase (glutamine-hydrolysing)
VGGIAGILQLDGSRPDPDQLLQLAHGVGHRGPDAKARWIDGPVALAHRRLQTTARAHLEPRVDERQAIVLDGRLFEGGVDELARAWEQDGSRCLRSLDGPFAFALWDRQREVLWLARDAAGRRPLFFVNDRRRIAFASEIPALLGLPWVSRELAHNHLAEYLSFRYVHAPRTLLRDVRALPPGHLLRVDQQGARAERWYRPRYVAPGAALPDPGAAAEAVDQALARSVEKRLEGQAPIALLLSGGLDSSVILHHARALGRTPPCFTVAMADDPMDESSFATRVASVFEAEHHVVRITNDALVRALSTASRAMGQPLPTAAAALQYLLFKEIRPVANVILSGDGGDEVLAGRSMDRIAARMRRSGAIGMLPGPARHLLRTGLRRAGWLDLGASQAHFGRERAIGGSRVFHSGERVEIFRDPGLVRPGIRRTVLDPLYQEVVADPINAILYVWQRGWLPEDGLARSDRMAGALGMEVRLPMLDEELRAAAAALPGFSKVRPRGTGFETKAPLRRILKEVLPVRLVNRPKRSLPNPLDRWLRTAGRNWLSTRLEELMDDPDGIFVPSAIARLEKEHRLGRRNHGLKLWTLALFWEWKRQLH